MSKGQPPATYASVVSDDTNDRSAQPSYEIETQTGLLQTRKI
jgi:hypothetical protein